MSENQEPTSETKISGETKVSGEPVSGEALPQSENTAQTTKTVVSAKPLTATLTAPLTGLVQRAKETIFTEQVQQEVGKAWQFTRAKVLPSIVKGLTWLVDKLDPPVSAGAQKFSQAVQTNSNWQKLLQNPNYQKINTAWQTVGRWFSQAGTLLWSKFTDRVTISESVQYILSKKAALTTIAVVLVTFWVLKPAPSRVAVNSANQPVASRSALPSQITKKISAVADGYGDGLVVSIVGSKQVGRLVVELNDLWYQLTPEQQDQLVTEMYKSAEKLKFPQMLVADNSHHLLARPATVGNTMVVVRR